MGRRALAAWAGRRAFPPFFLCALCAKKAKKGLAILSAQMIEYPKMYHAGKMGCSFDRLTKTCL